MKHRLGLVAALALVACAGLAARGAAPARAKGASAPIELEIPAGTEVTAEGAVLRHDGETRELRVEAPATLRLGKGILLRSQQPLVILPKAGAGGSSVIRIGGGE